MSTSLRGTWAERVGPRVSLQQAPAQIIYVERLIVDTQFWVGYHLLAPGSEINKQSYASSNVRWNSEVIFDLLRQMFCIILDIILLVDLSTGRVLPQKRCE